MDLMSWRELWLVAMGNEPTTQHVHPILATVLVYTVAIVFCQILYRLSYILPVPTILRLCILTFIKTMAFCTLCFGHAVMWKNFGGAGYMLLMVPTLTLCVYLFPEGQGSPLSNWKLFLEHRISTLHLVFQTIVQILAGFSAYNLGRTIYQLDFDLTFAKALAERECLSDLNVPVLVGFVIETIGVTLDAWFGMQPLSKFGPLDTALKLTFMGGLVCSGIGYTGMYIQPALATGMTFGCKGTNTLEHIFVYWVGPYIGIYLALQINKVVNLRELPGIGSDFRHESKELNGTGRKDINGNRARSKRSSKRKA